MNARSLLAGLMISFTLASPYAVLADQGDLPTKTSGPYVGIGAGYSKIDTSDDDALSVSGEDFSYRLLGGYRFAHLPLPLGLDFGIEAAYVDFGTVDEFTAGSNIEVDLSGIGTAGIFYLPISRNWDLFGKLGVYFWDGQVTSNGIKTVDENSSDLLFGLGVSMQTRTAFGAQFEVEALDALDGVWTATLSATYQFK